MAVVVMSNGLTTVHMTAVLIFQSLCDWDA